MDTLQAQNFSTRKAIELFIKQNYGTDIQANRSVAVIQGTKHQLALLGLSARTTVFGIATEQIEDSE